MKNIIIVRHAKSSWVDFSLSDFQRPLDDKGLSDAPVMADRLFDAGYQVQKIITSNATRAKTTAQFFANKYGLEMQFEGDLYHGEPEDYMMMIEELPESIHTVALFGHNPGITFIANMISHGITDDVPTCGIIVAQMGDIPWNKCNWDDMKIKELMLPKDKHE